MAVGILYLIYEFVDSPAFTKIAPPMFRFLVAVIIASIVAAVFIPRLPYYKQERTVSDTKPNQTLASKEEAPKHEEAGDGAEPAPKPAPHHTAAIHKLPVASPEEPPAVAEKPDLGMALVYPNEPAIVFVNRSGVVLREPKYSPGIWNLDRINPETGGPKILPIPVESGDWIRPHGSQGPDAFIGQANAKQFWKDGDRLFGAVTVTCPTCVTTRTYIVYIVCGKGGWYSELLSPTTLTWSDLSKLAKSGVDDFLANIPDSSRIQISER